jgi:hypothetical protein
MINKFIYGKLFEITTVINHFRVAMWGASQGLISFHDSTKINMFF